MGLLLHYAPRGRAFAQEIQTLPPASTLILVRADALNSLFCLESETDRIPVSLQTEVERRRACRTDFIPRGRYEELSCRRSRRW